MRGTSRAATPLKFNLLLRDERMEVIMGGGWMMVGGKKNGSGSLEIGFRGHF